MDTSRLVLKVCPPPKLALPRPKDWKFRAGKLLLLSGFCSKISGQNGFFYVFFFLKFCHADLDSRGQQRIPPDSFDHSRSIDIEYPNSRWTFPCYAHFLFENRKKRFSIRSPIYKLADPRSYHYLSPFFNTTNVFCAKKRMGHACICLRMVTS